MTTFNSRFIHQNFLFSNDDVSTGILSGGICYTQLSLLPLNTKSTSSFANPPADDLTPSTGQVVNSILCPKDPIYLLLPAMVQEYHLHANCECLLWHQMALFPMLMCTLPWSLLSVSTSS